MIVPTRTPILYAQSEIPLDAAAPAGPQTVF